MLIIGELAPDFELPNQNGELIHLSDYRGQHVIVFAFPKADTAGCNAQACGFRDAFPRFESADAVILGISTDSPDDLRAWKMNKQLPYDLLSDPNKEMLNMWGAGDNTLFGLRLSPGAKRSYWVIDPDGTILAMQVGVRPGQSVELALAALSSDK
jgi:peroxiredoxin Q/BCP